MYLIKAYGEVGDVEYNENASNLNSGIIFHDPRSDDIRYLVNDPKLDWSNGRSGSFTFTLTKDHRCYSSITPLKTYISVHYFNYSSDPNAENLKEYWRGRVVSLERRMNGNLSVSCEGIMSILSDVEYVDDYYESIDPTYLPDTVYPSIIMEHAIDCYNKALARTPSDFSECCRPFIFVPVNMGEQEPINPLTQNEKTTTNETVWGKIDSLANEQKGFFRCEYSPDIDKYILYYTMTNFDFNEDATAFSPDAPSEIVSTPYVTTRTLPSGVDGSYPQGSYVTYGGHLYYVLYVIWPYNSSAGTTSTTFYYRDFNVMWEAAPPVGGAMLDGKKLRFLEYVYKYMPGDFVTYNGDMYVFIAPHLVGDAWNPNHVVPYQDYSTQDIELGVNLIDIVRTTKVSELYSHLKAYGCEIKYVDIFEDMEVTLDDAYRTGVTKFNYQKGQWYRIPKVWYQWFTIVGVTPLYYMMEAVPTIRALDQEGVDVGVVNYTNYNTDGLMGGLLTTVAIANGSRVIFATNPKLINQTWPDGIPFFYFDYSGSTLPVGALIEAVTANAVYPTSVKVYPDPSDKSSYYTFSVSVYSSSTPGSGVINAGTMEIGNAGTSYYYITPDLGNQNIDLDEVSSISITHRISADYGPLVQMYPGANKSTLLTPTNVLLDYEILDENVYDYPSGLIVDSVFETYGRINATVNYDEISDRDELLSLAEDKVALDTQSAYSAKIKALDLSALMDSYKPFYPGFLYTIKPYSTTVDEALLVCNQVTIPLMNIQNAEYSFGIAPETITKRQYINGYWRRKN